MDFYVCVEVLWPSQHSRVMLSMVSLPNHTFTGQVKSSRRQFCMKCQNLFSRIKKENILKCCLLSFFSQHDCNN